MATVVNQKLNNIVECCICTEIFTDPRMLPCVHTFCVKCLTETGSKAKKGPGDKMPCPLCRTEFTIPADGFTGLQKNFFMDNIVEVVQLSSKQHVCDSNTGNCGSAKWYCDKCKQKLCDVHRKIHSQEHHILVPFENQTSDKVITDFCISTFCDQHEREELKIFCNDCHVVLCAICFLENHQSHKWLEVKDVAKKFKTQIENNIGLLSSCAPEARSILEQLDKDNIKFLETVTKVESEVNQKKLQVKALLNEIAEENASSLLLRLTSLKRTTSKQKEIEKEEIDTHLTKLDSYITFYNEIAVKGSDVEICRAVSESSSRAKDLKELHRTVMEPKSTLSDISFEARKAEDFLKTFGNLLGKIEGDHQDMATSQHQQQPVMFNEQDPQVIMRGMQYMTAQPSPTPQQSVDIRPTMMMPSRFSSQIPSYQQHPQQQQQQKQQQQQHTGFVQHEQPQYSMLPPDSNYHSAAPSMHHPAYYQRSDGSMPGNAPPSQVYAPGGQMQLQNPQQRPMFQQSPSMQRFPPKVQVRFQQPMPIQRMTPPSMQLSGMPQEMPTEAVAQIHIGELAQRPQFMPRQQQSDLNLEFLQSASEELITILKQHSDNQTIFQWIQRNFTPAEAESREFIRALVIAVFACAIMVTSSNAQSTSYSVSEAEIVSRQTLLQICLHHNPHHEIQALYALQTLVHGLQHPQNMLYSVFRILYNNDIIAEDSFWEWQNSTDPAEQTGKGVAFQSVRPFFDWIGGGNK